MAVVASSPSIEVHAGMVVRLTRNHDGTPLAKPWPWKEITGSSQVAARCWERGCFDVRLHESKPGASSS